MRNLNLVILIILSFLISGCFSTVRFLSSESNTVNNSNDSEYANFPILRTDIGKASYYAHKFHGRTTASGEKYDMYGLTAAHTNYSFGTIARITNTKNGLTAIVKINDRMPKHPTRIIDLSYGTAQKIGMIKDGVVTVKIEILKWGK